MTGKKQNKEGGRKTGERRGRGGIRRERREGKGRMRKENKEKRERRRREDGRGTGEEAEQSPS